MFIETKKFTVKKGYAENIINKFSRKRNENSTNERKKPQGLIDVTIMQKLRKEEHEEVVVMFRWESQQDHRNFKLSDAHKAGHKNKGEKPDFIINVSVDMYDVKHINM